MFYGDVVEGKWISEEVGVPWSLLHVNTRLWMRSDDYKRSRRNAAIEACSLLH